MYHSADIEISYQFSSSIFFPNGKQSELRKKELVRIKKKTRDEICICLLGSAEESLNANPLDDFDEIMAELGKSLYPIVLDMDESCRIKRIQNLIEVKQRWQSCSNELLRQYDNAYYIERYINSSSVNLKSEKLFLKALRSNTFIQLLFWNNRESDSVFSVAGFPHKEDEIGLCFEKKAMEGDNDVYRSSSIRNSKNGAILNGNAILRVQDREDFCTRSASIAVRLEAEGEGYYTKKVNIELLKE